MKEGINNIIKLLADDVSKNLESADEFIQDHCQDFDKLYNEKMGNLISKIARHKQQQGASNQKSLKSKFERFLQIVKNKSVEQIISAYPSLPQAAYSKLQSENLEEDEINNILKDASFLSFLEAEINSDEE